MDLSDCTAASWEYDDGQHFNDYLTWKNVEIAGNNRYLGINVNEDNTFDPNSNTAPGAGLVCSNGQLVRRARRYLVGLKNRDGMLYVDIRNDLNWIRDTIVN